MSKLPQDLKRQMFVRSLLLQSTWSYEGQQNLGFLFALDPALRRDYPDAADYREAAARHLEYFNTHPYMAGFVLGAVAAMEEERAAEPAAARGARDGRIRQIKRAMASSLAAVGDAFFWGSLRPACAACTLLLWLVLASVGTPLAGLWAALFYLAAFNLPGLWARWHGLRLGYELRENLPLKLKTFRWQKWSRWTRRAGFAAAVLVAAAAVLVPPWGGAFSWKNAGMLAIAVGLRVYGLPSLRVYAGAAAFGVLMGLLA